jgi:predicted dehydrogenase
MTKPTVLRGAVSPVSRRDFLRSTALVAGAVSLGAPALLRGQNLNNKLHLAAIGSGGKGGSDINCCSTEDFIAFCDVDESRAAGALRRHPQAKFFRDYRKLLDEVGKSIDAVTVSTPDHMHAVIASAAMSLGKHVYVQKPLTHDVYEARRLRALAKEKKVITQMGNQGSSEDGLRRAVECVHAGVIGPVHEIHVWSNRPIWPQGIDRPAGEDPVPANFDWNLWLGTAPFRPYKGNRTYHDFAWRGWLDFGTGALGDMACHTTNMPFRAAKLGYPTVVEAEDHSGMNTETYPKTSRIRFEFPAREGLPPLKFWWYDGKPADKSVTLLRPSGDVVKEIIEMRGELPGSGALLIGDKGKIFSPDDYGAQFFLKLNDEAKYAPARRKVEGKDVEHEALAAIPKTIPRSRFPGDGDRAQHQEWIAAIKENNPELCYSRFDIAAYLTEIILLGCVALRVGKGQRLDWNGPEMKANNSAEAARFVKRDYRAPWQLS